MNAADYSPQSEGMEGYGAATKLYTFSVVFYIFSVVFLSVVFLTAVQTSHPGAVEESIIFSGGRSQRRSRGADHDLHRSKDHARWHYRAVPHLSLSS